MTDTQARNAAMKKYPKSTDTRKVTIMLASLQILKRVAYRDGLLDGHKKTIADLSKPKTADK